MKRKLHVTVKLNVVARLRQWQQQTSGNALYQTAGHLPEINSLQQPVFCIYIYTGILPVGTQLQRCLLSFFFLAHSLISFSSHLLKYSFMSFAESDVYAKK